MAQGDAQVGLRLGSGNLDSDGGAECDPELGNHSASRAPSYTHTHTHTHTQLGDLSASAGAECILSAGLRRTNAH